MHLISVSALSHDGLVREHNEDSLVVGPWTLCSVVTPVPETMYFPVGAPVVVAVADGLGGHPAGEEASSLAVRWLAWSAPQMTDENAVREAIMACNQEVYAEADRDRERTAMGTTIAGLVVTESEIIIFNVGDSRVYLIGADLEQISTDDGERPLPGRPRSPVVTQTLGGSIEPSPVDPHIVTRPLTDSRYLVCSDGLTDTVDEAAIFNLVSRLDGGRAVFELWKATIDGGAPDNVTVALIEITSESPE